jgi:DNA-directed RNA polymerase specialized sigma subunit
MGQIPNGIMGPEGRLMRHRWRSKGNTVSKPLKEMTTEQKQLAEDNVKLVGGVIKFIKARRWIYADLLDDEDMRSAGLLGLCKAALYFDSTKGVKFSTYAWSCIINEIEKEAQSSQVIRIPCTAFRDDPRRPNGKRKENFCKVFSHQREHELPAEGCSQDYIDNKLDAKRFMAILKPYHHSVLTSAMSAGGNMSHAAREHGISSQMAQDICKRAIRQIRTRFQRDLRELFK